MLLELARDRAERIRIRWRSDDIGPWASVNPQWHLRGSRIRFEFRFQGRLMTFWAAEVRQTAMGISLSLVDPRSPLPERFEMLWQEPDSGGCNSGRLWRIVRQWLALRFPGHRILHATRRADLTRTLSGAFLRVIFRCGGKNRLLIAAEGNAADEVSHAVGQALIWISTLTSFQIAGSAGVLDILVPFGMSAVAFHRCRFLNRSLIRAEVWEYRERTLEVPEIRRAPEPPPPEENRDFRWPLRGPFRWSLPLQRVLDLAPELIRRYPRFHDYDSLRLRGLEFAQVSGADRGSIAFGVGSRRTALTEGNFDALRLLVEEIVFYRRPDCPDPNHPYYRLQAERWLEALVLENIPYLFPEMAPESVYSQIPVYLGRDSGRIDILGADRLGTLVVMELKVSADPDLPIQALDYWGRVIQHNENGDFQRRGYFSEVRATRQRPRIYLISPVFSFHDTTELLLRYLEPGLEIWKISINEDWRCGVKVLRRIRYKCGETGC